MSFTNPPYKPVQYLPAIPGVDKKRRRREQIKIMKRVDRLNKLYAVKFNDLSLEDQAKLVERVCRENAYIEKLITSLNEKNR